jgi:hypothetical protein
MRKRHRVRVLALTVGTAFLLTTPGIDAIAHEFDAPSTITLQASKKRVKRGKKVRLFGQVSSPQADCRGGREVAVVGAQSRFTTTDATGAYSVVVRPKKTGSYVATVAGSASGLHPHRHVCGGDISNKVRVRVRSPQ